MTAAAKIQPFGDNVLVRPIEEETTTASGIVIPDTVSKEKPMKGEVLSVGPGTKDKPTDGIKVGDTVIFTKYAPTEIKIDNEDLYLLGVDSLLAKETK